MSEGARFSLWPVRGSLSTMTNPKTSGYLAKYVQAVLTKQARV